MDVLKGENRQSVSPKIVPVSGRLNLPRILRGEHAGLSLGKVDARVTATGFALPEVSTYRCGSTLRKSSKPFRLIFRQHRARAVVRYSAQQYGSADIY